MRKVRKILFAFMFFILFGFNVVKAQSQTLPDDIGVLKGNMKFTEPGYFNFYNKTAILNSETRYVFCLESNRDVLYFSDNNQNIYHRDSNLVLYVPDGGIHKVNRIYSKAYELGLGRMNTGSYSIKIGGKAYTTDDSEMYLLTQMAIWKAVNGNGANGFKVGYQIWINRDSEKRQAIFDELVKASTIPEASEKNYNITVTGNGMHEDGDFLVSNEYTVHTNVPINDGQTIPLSYSGGDVSASDVQIKVDNGSWTTGTVGVVDGSKVTVKVPKPSGVGQVSLNFNINAGEFPAGWNTGIYYINNVNQNIAAAVPVKKTASTSFKIMGNYENEKVIYVQKVDSNTHEKVEGAKIGVYNANDNLLITTITSTDSESNNPSISLPLGDYYLKEISAPNNYILNETPVAFSVISDNGVVKVRQDGNVIEGDTVTLSLENTRRVKKIKFRKVNESGQPIAGVRIEIGSYTKFMTEDQDHMRICAITGSDGYLTQPCDIDNSSNFYDSTGEYNFEDSNDFYYIREQFTAGSGYYDEKFSRYSNVFSYIDGEIRSVNPNISIEYIDNQNVINFNIINHKYLDISKVDVNGGQELAGAKLNLYDMDIQNGGYERGSSDDDLSGLGSPLLVDSWESGSTPHRYVGIVPGHRYALVEEISPEGYIKIGSIIEFTMADDGTVSLVGESQYINAQYANTDTKYKLTVSNEYGKTIYVSKTSFVTGEEVPGAELKICTAAAYERAATETGDGNNCIPDKPAWIWESGTVPHKIEALAAGEYYIVESIAPVGYVKQTNSVKIVVKLNPSDNSSDPIEFKNEPTKVVISKKDFTTEDEIPGAHLKICTLDAYEQDGSLCEAPKDEWSWVSTDEPNYIEAIPFGDYVLIETLPADNYEEGMYVGGELLTAYKFSVTPENHDIKIDVYNKLLVDVPKTGISLINLIAIGGLMIFIGYETINIYRRRSYLNI